MTDWFDAACKGQTPLWFSETERADDPPTRDQLHAITTCITQCPIINECREYAVTNDERHGIWGGMRPNERRRLVRQRRLAAKTRATHTPLFDTEGMTA